MFRTTSRVSLSGFFCALTLILAASSARADTPVENLVCTVDPAAAAVQLTWQNTGNYLEILIDRDGMPYAVVAPTDTSFIDSPPGLPATYTVTPLCPGVVVAGTSCTAGGSPPLTSTWFTGFLHEALGQATLEETPDGRLSISNLGSSGLDGVRVSIPPTPHSRRVDFEFDNLDPATVPTGSVITLEGRGADDGTGVPNTSGQVRLTDIGDDFELSADFDVAGVPTYTVTVLDQGVPVYAGSGIPSGEVCARFPIKIRIGYKEYNDAGNVTESCLISIETTIFRVIGPGGIETPVEGDCILISPDAPNGPTGGLESYAVKCDHEPFVFYDIILRVSTVHFGGHAVSGAGDAHLEPDANGSGKLKVSNLGSSGCDGFSIAPPDDSGDTRVELDADFDPGDASYDDGDSMAVESWDDGVKKGEMRATKQGQDWAISADYAGSPTYTLQVLDAGQVVFEQSGMSGTGALARLKIRLFYREYDPETGCLVEKCFITTERSAVTIVGGPTVMGDVIRTLPDTVVPMTQGEMRVVGGGFEEFEVVSIQVTPAGPGLPNFVRGDANADALIDIGDPIFLLAELFSGGPASPCDDAADANDDGLRDLGDVINLLAHLFSGGTLPGPSSCGPDTTADSLGCAAYAPCP